MRWLLVLFSLYVVLLSGIPCDCQEDFICETTTSDAHHDNDHQKQDCPCSPFFACSTCHGVVIPDGGVKMTKPEYTKVPQLFPLYQENAISQYPLPVFQPPRMV